MNTHPFFREIRHRSSFPLLPVCQLHAHDALTRTFTCTHMHMHVNTHTRASCPHDVEEELAFVRGAQTTQPSLRDPANTPPPAGTAHPAASLLSAPEKPSPQVGCLRPQGSRVLGRCSACSCLGRAGARGARGERPGPSEGRHARPWRRRQPARLFGQGAPRVCAGGVALRLALGQGTKRVRPPPGVALPPLFPPSPLSVSASFPGHLTVSPHFSRSPPDPDFHAPGLQSCAGAHTTPRPPPVPAQRPHAS